MSIRFTKKVRDILEHINNYGFITNKQCALIYFKGAKQPYIQAQTKMKTLYDNGIVKRTECKLNREYMYSIDKEEISDHRMYLMNLYAYLYSKFDIIYFKVEESWQCKTRNDAHIIIKKDNGDMVGILCEIDLYHRTGQEKLDKMYESVEVQQWYKVNYEAEGYYPSILIVNSSGKTTIKSDQYEVVAVDFDFNGLDSIL